MQYQNTRPPIGFVPSTYPCSISSPSIFMQYIRRGGYFICLWQLFSIGRNYIQKDPIFQKTLSSSNSFPFFSSFPASPPLTFCRTNHSLYSTHEQEKIITHTISQTLHNYTLNWFTLNPFSSSSLPNSNQAQLWKSIQRHLYLYVTLVPICHRSLLSYS